METIKTHWKKIQNPLYIGAYELMQGDKNIELNVRITTVAREMVQGPDGKKEECTVMQIPPNKPMILNATNQKNLTKAIGSPFIEDWNGKVVTLYVAKVKAFGDTLDALRIKDKLPETKLPEFTPDNPQWAATIEAIKTGKNTPDNIIKAITKNYTLSDDNSNIIKNAAV